GVSATKDEVHKATSKLDKGLYPKTFCKILPDIAAHDPAWCNILHADTAGTKSALAYLYWRETGDLSVWKGIAQDAIVMNMDDMACVGCTEHFMLSNTIARNRHVITGDVIQAVIEGTIAFCEQMASFQIDIHHAGGETADVGDIVRTIDVGFTAFSRMQREELVINRIRHGDVIVGLASDGQSTYEAAYNSGIGSNGLTSARHDVLHKMYGERYPESYSEHTEQEYVYSGSKNLTDKVDVRGVPMEVGKLLLSPTRTYLPVLRTILRELHSEIHGIIHNTGSGQTKVRRFLQDGICVVKDGLPECPPVFNLIQSESGTSWEEMYQVFNMGCRMEIYVPPHIANEVIAMAHAYNINAWVIGRVEKAETSSVLLETKQGTFRYS
ncbi:MAG TPA: AIR synthase related protein, partial [Saprospiraceae bacterium]|nr:AIR synthase related protein [Saprospiraceae bacterium]